MAQETENKTQTFGRYRAVKILGEGSMGRVYLAEDPVLERTLAVKVVTVEKQLDERIRAEYLKRFILEARSSAKLNHPSIVTVHDAGQQSGIPWIAFEYVRGESLTALLAREKRLPVRKAVSIALDITAALHHAHAHGVVHRDVKPANILIDSVTGIAKLADFGIVKAPHAAVTQEGKIVGSPGYMSPEQIRGEPLDGRSDVFSLGVVLYEMATGKQAFIRESVINTMYATLNGEYMPAAEMGIDLPAVMEQVIRRCLMVDKQKRMQSAAAVIDLLRRVEGAYSYSAIKIPAGRMRTASLLMKKTAIRAQWLGTAVYHTARAMFAALRKSKALASAAEAAKRWLQAGVYSLAKGLSRVRIPRKALIRFFGHVVRPAHILRSALPLPVRHATPLAAGIVSLATACALALSLLFVVNWHSIGTPGQSAVRASRFHITTGQQLRIASCVAGIDTGDYVGASVIAQTLIETPSTAAYGYLLAGRIAVREKDFTGANEAFLQAKQQAHGRGVVDKNIPVILNDLEKILIQEKAGNTLIKLVAHTLKAGEIHRVKRWVHDPRYWLRWNGVWIQEAAGNAVDMVPVYILDLDRGASMRTRITAAQKLGESGDRRAVKPLIKAKKRGMRDPFVSAAAAAVLERCFKK
jgi:hypothetical protein